MQYKFKFNLNDQDYYEFNKYHLSNAPDMKKRNFWLKLYVPALFLLMLVFNILNGYDLDWLYISVIIYSVISVIWIFSIKYLALMFLKLRIRIMEKNGKMPYSKSVTMHFFEDYFTEITPDTKSDVKYTAVTRISVSASKAIYIYTNIILAYIIPYNAFHSQAEHEEFLQFINEKVSTEHTDDNV